MANDLIELTHDEWLDEGRKRYGDELRGVRLVCPACGYVQTFRQFLDLGMTHETAHKYFGLSCLGRFTKPPGKGCFDDGPGPCDYAGGGLIRLAKVVVKMPGGGVVCVFDFADDPLVPAKAGAPADGK